MNPGRGATWCWLHFLVLEVRRRSVIRQRYQDDDVADAQSQVAEVGAEVALLELAVEPHKGG